MRSIGPRFQSLLSWIGLLNASCHSGLRTAAHGFQSLLSWIGLLNYSLLFSGSRVLGFQSLLSWIGLLNQCILLLQHLDGCGFNPCCPGSASSTIVEHTT